MEIQIALALIAGECFFAPRKSMGARLDRER